MRLKIHPAIGIARVGDSPDGFYLAPEQAGHIPNELNQDGTEQPVKKFKDGQGRVKRQAARFRVFAYDDHELQQGKEIKVGDLIKTMDQTPGESFGQELTGHVVDIQWTAYLANKKASWFQFRQLDGEHGYDPSHPLRNARITDADGRQQLIIDPGPQTVSYKEKKQRTAQFARGANPGYTQSFPPPLQPNSIDTLGEMRAIKQGEYLRLLVLGGHGNSGSRLTGFGQPVIQNYANNDGWFDDVSDGPVMAQVKCKIHTVDGQKPDPSWENQYFYADVEAPAWCLVGYPRYVPEILDIITMDEVAYDVAVREFGYDTYLYGTAPFSGQAAPDPSDAKALALWRESAQWNPDYYPYFYRDIWPILTRPQNFQYVFNFDQIVGGDPHNPTKGGGGNFDEALLSVPPFEGEDPGLRAQRARWRMRIWYALRKPGQENIYSYASDPSMPKFLYVLMPFLCGDNPLSNTVPSKFLRLTDTQLFIIGQWAMGKFINEHEEGIPSTDPEQSTLTGTDIDRGVLSNALGGSFCPGGEACWIIRNPAIYAEPFRIKHSPYFSLQALQSWQVQPLWAAGTPVYSNSPYFADAGTMGIGLEPGDITKYSAVPWQADFNECTTNSNDITYEKWNEIYLPSVGDPARQVFQTTYWWPAHRPIEVNSQAWTQGIPQTNAGDLKMVTAWTELGFVVNQPQDDGTPNFVQVEQTDPNS